MDAGHQDRGHQAGVRLALATAALLLAGCAALEPQPLRAGNTADAECLRWFEALDATVDRARVRDAENHRIAGFPALRINRLEAAQAAAADAAWIERLRTLDEHDRRIEIDNLPADAPRDALLQRLPSCSRQLADAAHDHPGARLLLRQRAAVPATARWPAPPGCTR